MAKKSKCGNGHTNGATDKQEVCDSKDGRFCPPLLKLMIPHERGTTVPRKHYGHVADGHD